LVLVLLGVAPGARGQERPADIVDAATVVEGLMVEARYYGAHNFVGTQIDGYDAPRCLLTAKAAHALAAVQHDLAKTGLGLKVFDCYRPTRAVAHFVRWAKDIADLKNKVEFYPDVPKRDLFRDGYIAERSSHSRGSTVDLTVVRLTDGEALDMGTGFDLFSPKSWPNSKAVAPQQHANRVLLAGAMQRHGFVPYPKEWWHFTLADEPYPGTYFNFPVR
jgi:D-alanyl-D-alanine dipeptidase